MVPADADASKVLNQLPGTMFAELVPDVNVKLGALEEVPPSAPPLENVLLIVTAVVNPPVPVHENPVKVLPENGVLDITQFEEPKLMILVPDEPKLIEPLVKVYPLRFIVPFERLQAPDTVKALPRVHSPPAPSNVRVPRMVEPLVVIVCPVLVETNLVVAEPENIGTTVNKREP